MAQKNILSEETQTSRDIEERFEKSFRLDRPLHEHLERTWECDGAEMRPYLAGVRSILGAKGVSRVIDERVRILRASNFWPVCNVMGRALTIFHKNRSGRHS